MAKQLTNAVGIPAMVENYSECTENGIHHGARLVPAPQQLLRQLNEREIWRTQEVRDLIRIHLDAGLLASQPGVTLDSALEADLKNWCWILLNPLVYLVEKRQSLDLDSSEIVDAYRRFRDVWRGNLHCEVVVPLLGLEGELPSQLKIGKLYSLSRFTPQEKTRLAGRWLNQSIITSSALQRSKFKLSFEKSYNQQKQAEWQTEIQSEAERAITAMRLSGTGRVGAPAFFEHYADSGLSVRVQNLPNLEVPEFVPQSLSLTSELIQRTLENYQLLDAAKSGSSNFQLDVSLRRFNQAYSRDNFEDQVLDYTIALESCLLRGISDELSYRFAIRGAAVAAAKRDPLQTHSELKRIYAARSKIVHEGKMPDPTLAELSNELCRMILLCYLERLASGESVKAISEELDSHVVRSLQPPKI